MRRLAGVFLFLALLIPSAWFAWRNRDMPQFGDCHDDSVYFVCARSFAEGSGYRILSLPEQPYQTKYPPLYPLWLSLAWRLSPGFPENLTLALALNWLTVPVFLLLARKCYVCLGFSGPKVWILTALTALNPYLILFGASLVSEIFFSCLLLGCLWCYRRAEVDPRVALAVGVLGSLAYLARTAGAALLAPAILLLLWRRRWRNAALVAVPAAVAALGWMLWTRAHQSASSDLLTIYYTNYLRYEVMNVTWTDLPLFVWKNLDALLKGMGALVVPDVTGSFLIKILTQTIAVGMIVGVVRLVRRGGVALYGWFCLFYSLMLLVWHFPPNERFALPMFPLLFAGLWTEMEVLWRALRAAWCHPQVSQRIAAGSFGAVATAVLLGALLMQSFVVWIFMPTDMRAQRHRRGRDRAAYHWIAANLPVSASVLAYKDPVLFLYTERRAASLTVMPVHWYRSDHAKMIESHASVVPYAWAHGLSYAYVTDADFHRDMDSEDSRAVLRNLGANRGLVPLYRSNGSAVYEIRGTPGQ
jgi:hypothetical protein